MGDSFLAINLNSLNKCGEINPRICKIIEKVVNKIVPSNEDEERVLDLSRKVFDEISKHVLPLKSEFKFDRLELHGSVAKGTWLPNRIDLDIFIVFNDFVEKKDLEVFIKRISKVVPFKFEFRYSEHPYLHFPDIYGFEVDLVPAFDFGGKKFVSATDRTLYHTRYIKDKLDDILRNEVRLLKAFMKGIDCYGAEIKVGGFSGYALELLIIKFGSFLDVIDFLSRTKSIFIDFTGTWKREKAFKFFNSRFVIIDPVDPRRNVLAPLREDTFYVSKLASRLFKFCPSENFFWDKEDGDSGEFGRERKIFVAKIVLDEYFPEDKIWGILLRISNSLRNQLSREKFEIYLIETIQLNEFEYLVVIEANTAAKPRYVKIYGPPVDSELKHIIKFIEKYRDAEAGPWVEGDRLVVIKEISESERNIIGYIEKTLEILLKRYGGKISLKWINELENLEVEYIKKLASRIKKKIKWIKNCGAPIIYNANPD